MRGNGYLFFEGDLDAQLSVWQYSVSRAVDRILKDQFLVSGDLEIDDHEEDLPVCRPEHKPDRGKKPEGSHGA